MTEFLTDFRNPVKVSFLRRRSSTWKEFLRENARSASSLLNLMVSHRWLFKFLKEESYLTSALLPAYESYVTGASSRDMAVSLRLAAFVMFVCRQMHPGVVIDLGSGFSSYALRLVARSLPNMVIYSVDADLGWLEATRLFLSRREVSTDGLYTLDDFRRMNKARGDLILFDILHTGDGTRTAVLDELLLWTKASSLVIVDDMHKRKFRRAVNQWTVTHNTKLIDLEPLTRDEFHRFASLVYGFPGSAH